ncbi:phosphoenolpyruvate synthetase regulatory protein [Exiguobacterium sp. Leaf187]|uniref:Putative pyruvate, phosphate dikinase regulatory protein n=1 Tax=Exiguobacterium indicum TaxID=296995 RepID=A0A0V8GFV0_9BACL|nr:MULTISPECIES: pyruvate, water dikinase regulatory protein [Exiguobacterium]HBQ75815.1 kinase/pyrophosphorylase [Exiguobacterium sp.]KNH33931.1 phosphotransferase [Exiguobacterium acetylicum]KQS20500.1 phosphoenolpyruvate synthetase regulatory protein [Exiguobacterium sp. Leaf187]KSU49160.1 phosphoenolpyruvate synthetase regulatory protein [Exiguobacterium enclense]KTR59652.1 phosphotransferase [Exiguobacterium indicum]
MRQRIYVVSDSVGETCELVVRAAAIQFPEQAIETVRIPFVDDDQVIYDLVLHAKEEQATIAFTIVHATHRRLLADTARAHGVKAIDLLGPLLDTMEDRLQMQPKEEPGLIYRLDEEYFRKIEAVEFAVKYDDGRDPKGIKRADIVLIGVSRTSKTPLSQYLALKRYKVANVPLVPESIPPAELFDIPKEKCFGLLISPEKLIDIRMERLRSLGLKPEAAYAQMDRINRELEYARNLYERIGCQVIDVTNKAVEETANLILTGISGKAHD